MPTRKHSPGRKAMPIMAREPRVAPAPPAKPQGCTLVNDAGHQYTFATDANGGIVVTWKRGADQGQTTHDVETARTLYRSLQHDGYYRW